MLYQKPIISTSSLFVSGTILSGDKHVVTSFSSNYSYTYNANGNMLTRVEGGVTYTQTFDAENRLISVAVSGQNLWRLGHAHSDISFGHRGLDPSVPWTSPPNPKEKA